MVAVSASLVSLVVSCLLIIIGSAYLLTGIEPAQKTLYPLALSCIILFLGLNSSIGLIAGSVFSWKEKQHLAIVKFSLIVNGIMLTFVVGYVVFSVINS